MDLVSLLHYLIPSWISVVLLLSYFVYLGFSLSILPGKIVPGTILRDGSRIHYCCNGLVSLLLLVALLGIGAGFKLMSPTVIADRGLELLSASLGFSFLVTLLLYAAGRKSQDHGSSLKPHVTGNFIHDWWFGIQLNPQFMGVDLKFFFVRAGMMGWLLINLSVLVKSIQDGNLSQSMILYQLFCVFYILDYFFYEELMTSTWDIIAEKLGFMLVFGDLVWIPFTFSIQDSLAAMGWWLLRNKVELTKAAALANCLVYLIGYRVFRGANKQKHVFKKNPKAPIWGRPPKVIGGKLLASGYWESFERPRTRDEVEKRNNVAKKKVKEFRPILTRFSAVLTKNKGAIRILQTQTGYVSAVSGGTELLIIFHPFLIDCGLAIVNGLGVARHCNYLGDLLVALSFSLPCGASSPVPYFYPLYLLILLIWRERRDEVRCSEKYKEVWVEYCKLVPWRILPYVY